MVSLDARLVYPVGAPHCGQCDHSGCNPAPQCEQAPRTSDDGAGEATFGGLTVGASTTGG